MAYGVLPLSVHLDRTIPAPRAQSLIRALSAGGATVCDEGQGTVHVGVGFASVERERGPTIALLDEGLGPGCAGAMRRSPPTALLAAREGGVPTTWEVRLLVATFGGATLYDPASPPPIRLALRRKFGIQAAAQEAAAAAREAGGGTFAASCAADVMHEIAANALLVAPILPNGAPKYAHQRDSRQDISTEDGCEVAIWLNNDRIFLSATDRFGRLTPAPLANALAGYGKRARVDVSGGGAGLGLRRILEQSDLMAVRVTPGRECEVTCAVELADNRRRSGNLKSLFFHTVREPQG